MRRAFLIGVLLGVAGQLHAEGPETRAVTGVLEKHESRKSHDPVEGSSGWGVGGIPLTYSDLVSEKEIDAFVGRPVEVIYHHRERREDCGSWSFHKENFIEQGPPGYDPYVTLEHDGRIIGYARHHSDDPTRMEILSIREKPDTKGSR